MSHLPDVYAIINKTDLPSVDFSQIGETDSNTIRESLDETQFVIKWSNEHEPTFITDGTIVPLQTLTHEQALTLMDTTAWTEEEIL